MGMLTGAEIKRRVENGSIFISDFDPKRVNPNSYNLRLGNQFKVYSVNEYTEPAFDPNYFFLDSKQKNFTYDIETNEKTGIIIQPGVLYLGTTMERTYAEDLIPCISGRSSFARLGLAVHQTAGFGDIGVSLHWTLEIWSVVPVKIYPGQEICQIYFEEPTGDTIMKYQGKYQDSPTVRESRLYREYGISE